MERSGIKGFKGNSGSLQMDKHEKAAKNGTNRGGSMNSIVQPTSSDKSGKKVMARRKANQGGKSGSSMQGAIGGPFMGQAGPKSKGKRMSDLPS